MNSDKPISKTRPFFIVGSGRSGSTLLRVILASHPRISIPPETWYILDLVKKFPANQPLTPEQQLAATEIVTSHYRWPDLNIRVDELKEWMSLQEEPSLRGFLETIYQQYARREGKGVWGDKTPPYVNILPELSDIFPEARFIHLVRDGHDVSKSFQNMGTYGPGLYANAAEWKKSVNAFRSASARDSINSRTVEIRYEDLVLDTVPTIKRICDFIGIEFAPTMLDWEHNLSEKIPSREAHIHSKLSRKPRASDVLRWEKEMSPLEVLIVESHIANELKWAGYKVRFGHPEWKPILLVIRAYCETVVPLASFLRRAFAFIWKRAKKVHHYIPFLRT